MKKIIALALALLMALSMASVAFAAAPVYAGNDTEVTTAGKSNGYYYYNHDGSNVGTAASPLKVAPGTKILIDLNKADDFFKGWTAKYDFTKGELCGASLIEGVSFTKDNEFVVLTLKESKTLLDAPKSAVGKIELWPKGAKAADGILTVYLEVNNNAEYVVGAKKADAATTIYGGANTVVVMDEDGGYVTFGDSQLKATVKMNKEEEVFFEQDVAIAEETQEAIEEFLGEDYLDEAVVEYYTFASTGFANEVAFQYDAYEEDPHFFYAWNGEAFEAIEAKFNDDEDVMKYEFTAEADGIIFVTDVEIVLAAEETKNPDTGANDVVGVAAALAVVSLVAAGAVSLKK